MREASTDLLDSSDFSVAWPHQSNDLRRTTTVSDGETTSDGLAIRSWCQSDPDDKAGSGRTGPVPDILEGGRFFFSFENVVSLWFRQILRHKVVYTSTQTLGPAWIDKRNHHVQQRRVRSTLQAEQLESSPRCITRTYATLCESQFQVSQVP
jgi:hypothetical protein